MSEKNKAEEAQAEEIQVEETTRQLKVDLTQQERLEFARKLTDAMTAREQAEDDMKSVVSRFKAEIAQHDAEVTKCATIVRNGWDLRDVPCEIRKDFGTGMISVIRLDTKENIEHRPMTDYERQGEIF